MSRFYLVPGLLFGFLFVLFFFLDFFFFCFFFYLYHFVSFRSLFAFVFITLSVFDLKNPCLVRLYFTYIYFSIVFIVCVCLHLLSVVYM